jgi:hypothetical protein
MIALQFLGESMNATGKLIQELVRLRLLVGFLGEKHQAKWWDCGFLDVTGKRFLQTTFPRTFLPAAVRSTTEAARLVHDSRIGRVGVFHLFRLPVDIEDQLEAWVSELAQDQAEDTTLSWDAALDELNQFSESQFTAPEGPVQVGVPKKILTAVSISELAAHYHSAFSNRIHCFPYFASSPNGKN